jgi:hypothetical protein
MKYWNVYFSNIDNLHWCLRKIGVKRIFFYSKEFYNIVLKNYDNKISGRYIIIYNVEYVTEEEVFCTGTLFEDLSATPLEWDYDFDYIVPSIGVFCGVVDGVKGVRNEKLKRLINV